MGDQLPHLLEACAIRSIDVFEQDETAERASEGFSIASRLWLDVIDNVRSQLISQGHCTASDLDRASHEYEEWIKRDMQQQTLSLRAVKATV
jgi:TPP-dependent pyruvate/acetoin dehydrogenase alpha subunit